jgi:heme/copper-type cytochrome/quinol oxidase subunit 1
VGAREAFTDLMRWGIFPPAAVFLVLCAVALVRAQRGGTLRTGDVRVIGFIASAALSVLGWVLGALIRGSTTTIPAHYHAAIGAVTVAFMTASYPLLRAVGVNVSSSWLAARQPALFAVGQSVFALGFAIAGSRGMNRKVYGQEQQVNDAAHSIGLAVMGLGGVLAIIAGVLFLALVVAALVRRRDSSTVIAWASGGTHG